MPPSGLLFLRIVNRLVSSTSGQATFWWQAKENTHWVQTRLTDPRGKCRRRHFDLSKNHRGSLASPFSEARGLSDRFHRRTTLPIAAAGESGERQPAWQGLLPPGAGASGAHTLRPSSSPGGSLGPLGRAPASAPPRPESVQGRGPRFVGGKQAKSKRLCGLSSLLHVRSQPE